MSANGSTDKKTLLSVLKELTFFVAVYSYFAGFIYVSYFYGSFGIPLRSIDTPVYYFLAYSYYVLEGARDLTWKPLLNQPSLWTSVTAIVVACGVLILRVRQEERNRILLLGLLALLFPFLFHVARATAKADALKVRTQVTAKEITLVLKHDASPRRSIKLVQELVNDGATLPTPHENVPATSNTSQDNCKEPSDAELAALQRFADANRRTEIKDCYDPDVNISSHWPKLYLVTETADRFYVILQPYLDKGPLPYGYVYEIAKTDVLISEIKIPQPN